MSAHAVRRASIIVLGDINVDIIGRVEAWPQPEKIASRKNWKFAAAEWALIARSVWRAGG
jgi:hypothetical protein